MQIAEFKDKEKELQVREDKLLDFLINSRIDQKTYDRELQSIRASREDIINSTRAKRGPLPHLSLVSI